MHDLLLLLQNNSPLLYGSLIVTGLIIGSFLNVVIHRIPLMLENEWKEDCKRVDINNLGTAKQGKTLSLSTPGSSCPHCLHSISWYDNIPVLSYLLLKGRCRHCQQHISLQYPIVEIIAALLAVICFVRFGYSWQAFFSTLLAWQLLTLITIDIRWHLLPDRLTLPFLWLGLLINTQDVFIDIESSVFGAVFGYLSLWSIFHLYKLVRKKDAMGYGDFKLLAMFGAWIGWQKLPFLIFLSSISGAIVGIFMIIALKHGRHIPIAFGPYIAVAGWICLLWGNSLIDTYTALFL